MIVMLKKIADLQANQITQIGSYDKSRILDHDLGGTRQVASHKVWKYW